MVGSTVQLQVELMDDRPTEEARASILFFFFFVSYLSLVINIITHFYL